MWQILVRKELTDLVQQRRYLLLLVAVGAVSLLTSFLAVQEYHQAQRHADALVSAQTQILAQVTSPSSLTQLAIRRPSALELIAPGISYDLGRWATNRADAAGLLTGALYTQEPLFAIVRTIDPLYVIQIVLSLVALLLSHGMISQERELGTLRLLFSHPVPRLTVYLAKGTAVMLALMPMLLITLLLPLCFGLFSSINFTEGDLFSLLGIMGIALVYLSCCVAIGLAASIWWRTPRMSMLGALSVWIILCLAWPRLGMTAVRMAAPISSEAEIEAQAAAFEIDRWRKFEKDLISSEHNAVNNQSDEQLWKNLQLSDSLRRLTESEIAEHRQLLRDNLVRQQAQQHQLAMMIVRLSPASALALASSRLAGTDPDLAVRYYDALKTNFERFQSFVEEVSKTVPDNNRFSISVETRNGVPEMKVDVPRRSDPLDLANMPAFVPPASDQNSAGPVALDLLALIGSLCLFGIVGLWSFLKADMR